MARSFVLAMLVHVLLAAVMFLGVRMQSHPPTVVTVELWDPPPPPPVVEAPKPPPPVVKPQPEPEVKKPDIAVREKPKPKPEPKLKPKPEPKRDLASEKRLREQLLNEQRKLDDQRRLADEARKERELRDLLARQQAAAQSKALAAWSDKIRAKIRGNIILPPDLSGNPEAIFDVALLPTGEVLTVRRRKSSGWACPGGPCSAQARTLWKVSSPISLNVPKAHNATSWSWSPSSRGCCDGDRPPTRVVWVTRSACPARRRSGAWACWWAC